MQDIIDIDTGAVIAGDKTIEQMGEAILELVVRGGQRRDTDEGRNAGSGRLHPVEAGSVVVNQEGSLKESAG